MRQEALKAVFEIAKKNPKVIFVGSDLGVGTLNQMKEELPNQFFMEGISEQYLVGFVSGLAKEGFIPYVNTIANFFTRRAFEQIAMDTALHNLPVRFLASGGGMVYAPLGPTHTAIEDLGLMSLIPGMRIFSPVDANEMRSLINFSETDTSPWYIRFGKGGEPLCTPEFQLDPTKPKLFGDESGLLLIVSTGVITHQALATMDYLNKSKKISTCLIHIPEFSNLNFNLWRDKFINSNKVLVIEEHILQGGLFNQLLLELHRNHISSIKLKSLTLPKVYSHNYGNQTDHFEASNLSTNKLIKFVEDWDISDG